MKPLSLARLGNASALWAALGRGADPNPPLIHLAVMLCRHLFGEHEWALRLPAMLGYCVGFVSLFSSCCVVCWARGRLRVRFFPCPWALLIMRSKAARTGSSTDGRCWLCSAGNWMVEALSHHRYPVDRAPYNMLGTDLGTEITGLDFGYPTVFYSAGDKSALTENGKVSTIIPFHTAYDKPHADNEILPLQDK